MQIASSCPANVTPFHFWSPVDYFPDLVDCMSKLDLRVNSVLVAAYHGSAIRMEHFALSSKQDVESVTHFLFDCSYFKLIFLSLWRNLKIKITLSNQADGVNIFQFTDNLDPEVRSSSQDTFQFRRPLFTIRQCNKYVNQEIYSGSYRQNS